jgi:hypothetical protein
MPPSELFHAQTRIIQTADYVIILQAHNHVFRIIPLDNRPRIAREHQTLDGRFAWSLRRQHARRRLPQPERKGRLT